MSDALEARLDELAAKVEALEDEVAAMNKRFRKLRKRIIENEGGKTAGTADANDD